MMIKKKRELEKQILGKDWKILECKIDNFNLL